MEGGQALVVSDTGLVMAASKVTIEILRQLEPVRAISETRLRELADLCIREHVPRNKDPFRGVGFAGQIVYLIKGELALV